MTSVVIVEITDEPIIQGRTGSKDGRQYTIPDKQAAYAHQGSPFPLPFSVPIPSNSSPYRPGMYMLGAHTFRAGQYGPIVDDREMRLIPIAEALEQLGKYQVETVKAVAATAAKAGN